MTQAPEILIARAQQLKSMGFVLGEYGFVYRSPEHPERFITVTHCIYQEAGEEWEQVVKHIEQRKAIIDDAATPIPPRTTFDGLRFTNLLKPYNHGKV